MTETAQFRIQLPVTLRDRFKALCVRGNVTMTDKVVTLIERDVAGPGTAPSPPQQKIATLTDDHIIGRVVDACDQLGNTAASLGHSLNRSFEALEAKLLRAIPKTLSPDQLTKAQQNTAEQDRQRLGQLLAKTERLNLQIVDTVAQGHRQMAAAFAVKHSLRQAVGAGALLGLVAAGLLLWLLAGTSPARSLAVALTGGGSDWQAARIIAGDGSPLRGELMSETVALLRNPDFVKSYGECMRRAKAAKRDLRCTIRFAPLVAVN